MASAGCRKNDGVPVLESVAAIFRQMMPDLPMPVVMTRPSARREQFDGSHEPAIEPRDEAPDGGRLGFQHSPRQRELPVRVGRWARVGRRQMGGEDVMRAGCAAGTAAVAPPIAACTRVDLREQGTQQIETERVLRVALGGFGSFVDLEEHAVDPGGDAGAGHGLDELRLARGDAVARAGQLQRVRDVVDHGHAERTQLRERAHVHDEVVVAETRRRAR